MSYTAKICLYCVVLVGLGLIIACTEEDKPSVAPVAPVPEVATGAGPSAEEIDAVYVGDLDKLKQVGRLRILIPANVGGAFYLPREGWPVETQQEAAEDFARRHGLEPELVPVARFADMIPALLEGRGDVIAANLTVTEARRERIAFSVPITTVRQQVLVASSTTEITGAEDLVGKRVMVDPGSSFWERLESLRKQYPGIELVPRQSGMTDEEELDQVARGVVDATVRDSNIADMYLNYRDDMKAAFKLPDTDDIAWGIRPDSEKLRAALNKFLHFEFYSNAAGKPSTVDLDGIKKRRVLRVLLPNNAASYFLYRGELYGFEYELAKAFAKANKLRVEIIVPETHEQLLSGLLEGRGDIAAGFLEPNEEAKKQSIAFSRPYHYAPRHLVVHKDSPVSTLQHLDGLTVLVRRSSPYWDDLHALKATGANIEIEAASAGLEIEELIALVAEGEIEATVADGHLLDIELARDLPVKSGLLMSEERPHAVAVRDNNPKLLAKLNAFIKKQYRGLVYNILYKKYFTNSRNVRDLAAGRLGGGEQNSLSPYDDTVQRYAEKYGFDWRLIVAQMYQESRFDPKAESFAGAKGLLQVMPRTAKFMGFEKLNKPEDGIHAGIKYLDWVRNRFEETLPFGERMWFALAAYNAGHGHVSDARRLARQQGWNGDVWFDNTERAMLLLSKKQYAKKARYGYVRGSEPVTYVRNIRVRYRAYADIFEKRLSDPGTPAEPADARLAADH